MERIHYVKVVWVLCIYNFVHQALSLHYEFCRKRNFERHVLVLALWILSQTIFLNEDILAHIHCFRGCMCRFGREILPHVLISGDRFSQLYCEFCRQVCFVSAGSLASVLRILPRSVVFYIRFSELLNSFVWFFIAPITEKCKDLEAKCVKSVWGWARARSVRWTPKTAARTFTPSIPTTLTPSLVSSLT